MKDRKNFILFGAGLTGKAALNFYGENRVYCFADNFKAGQEFCGKKVISFEELTRVHQEHDVVITVNVETTRLLKTQCAEFGIPSIVWTDTVTYCDYDVRPEIAQFKNKHKGLRCFLIGNGPSLSAEDLNRLYENKEISFGCNHISKIYGNTAWRPNYYLVTDLEFLNDYAGLIANTEADTKFLPIPETYYYGDAAAYRTTLKSERGEVYFYNKVLKTLAAPPVFSQDPSRGIHDGYTVMYSLLQMAAYMGFQEIYLLGVDNTQNNKNDTLHFYENNHDEIINPVKLFISKDLATMDRQVHLGYVVAEQYSRSHGFRIYNATRGGCLDTFEYVDFANLFD